MILSHLLSSDSSDGWSRVALLTNKISNVYVRVSTEHILPAQRQVVRVKTSSYSEYDPDDVKAAMLQFSDNTVEGRKTLMANLTLKQRALEHQATRQSEQVSSCTTLLQRHSHFRTTNP